jgi:hypothetical protein
VHGHGHSHGHDHGVAADEYKLFDILTQNLVFEHRNPCFSSVELVEKKGSIPYMIYTETVSKNNPGGLKHRKVEPKQVPLISMASVVQGEV